MAGAEDMGGITGVFAPVACRGCAGGGADDGRWAVAVDFFPFGP